MNERQLSRRILFNSFITACSVLAACLAFPAGMATAQEACGTSPASVAGTIDRHSGKYLPAQGVIRGLVLYMQMPEDDQQDATWPLRSLPVWWSDLSRNLRDYFLTMSGGKLILALDTYPAPIIAQGSEQAYVSTGRNFGNAARDVLAGMDDTLDFAKYDNWNVASEYEVMPGHDQRVDLIIVIYRNLRSGTFMPFTGVSDLGFSSLLFIDGGSRFIYGGSGNFNDAGASGLTIARNPGSGLVMDETFAFRVTIHEFMHKLYGESHPAYLYGGLGVLSTSSGGEAMSSFERHTLGYMTYVQLPQTRDTVVTFRDYLMNNEAYLMPIDGLGNWYYAFEFRSKRSRYDTAPADGLYVFRIHDPPNPSQEEICVISADGNYQWTLDSLTNKPIKVFPDPLSGYSVYQKIPLNGKPYWADGWWGDPKSAFTMARPNFSPWHNPSPDFLLNGDTVRTGIHMTLLSMSDTSATVAFTRSDPVILRIDDAAPMAIALRAPYPNPTSGSPMTLEYTLESPETIDLAVYDLLGRRVAAVDAGMKASGLHRAMLDAGGLPAGSYFAILRTGTRSMRQAFAVTY